MKNYVMIVSTLILIFTSTHCGGKGGGSGNEADQSYDVSAPWEGGAEYYKKWTNGPSSDLNSFPIAVWLQSAANIAAYRSIGINYFIGLYMGPTEDQLAAHTAGQMPVFCSQNAAGLASANKGIIRSWTQRDEPDNAVSGTEDPVTTADIISIYHSMVSNDSSRPVYLNLGQGAASDAWYGRGTRTNHPEDYIQYVKGADILCFDIYPMNVFPVPEGSAEWKKAFHNTVAQNIWYVAAGVDRLRQWSDYKKPVWAWIECTNINGNSGYALTPVHVKAEVWMALIHGARGIGYFVHQFSPSFNEKALLTNTEMKDAVSAVNTEITLLAPVLNTRSITNGVKATPDNLSIPVDVMLKRLDGYTYVFAVSMRPGSVNARFSLRDFPASAAAEVIGEGRVITVTDGVFNDTFSDYSVHLYKIR